MSRPSTPAEAYELLLEGNRRFVESTCEHPNQDAAHRAALVPGQKPFAVLLGCSDSRLAAEIIFDQGLGDLFVVRTAGHVAGPEVLGSIEYGVGPLGAPLVVVLGHDSCGAVTAARQATVDGANPQGYIGDLVEKVTPSVLSARAEGVEEVDDIVDVHVERTTDLLLSRSAVLAERVREGKCAIAGLSYRLGDGTVRQVASRGPLT
ncbi:carbonic anhydrase [Saccharopolyspora griseoalba]|uniref:carbonic anhydrase n=1 Tax=Saccharopolyspora griseoalba TaxID=1431848 RepID=A0ABW2LDC7_9PSEU